MSGYNWADDDARELAAALEQCKWYESEIARLTEDNNRLEDMVRGIHTLIAERDKWKQHADSYMADVIILRAALQGLYNEFSESNDFRPDSGVAREARRALEGSKQGENK